jgi:polysaccharide chain length determinant protein (PEP-CTERM system associated)
MNDKVIKITPEFILELAIRRRWIILTPLCLALIIGIVLALILPKKYQASTLILIEPQRVPQNYVQSIVSSEAGDRINTLSQQIMSRTNLEKIISDFNLFSDPKQADVYMEDKIENLRRCIDINVTRDRRGADAFSISFKGQDPQKVMRVTNALATSFIDQNLKARESQALGTSDFLDSELKSMRQRLEQVEEKIKEYRKTYMGELPEQLDTNLRILDRLQEDLNDRQQSIREGRVRMAELNSASTRSQQVVVISDAQPRSNDGASVEELKAQLETLSARYTEKHPDVLRLKKQISEMEDKQQADAADNNQGQVSSSAHLPLELRRQMAEARREIQVAESEIKNLKQQIAAYQQRVENTPKREQELLGLRRDYQNIQASYDSLLSRKLEADIAVNMERKQKGEQFRIVDPARLPQKPVEPNMKKLFLMVVAGGLALGGGIAFLLEYVDTSFRKPDEMESMYELPVLTSINTVYQPRQLLLRKMNNVASIAFAAFTMGCLAVFAYVCIRLV